MMNLSPSYSFRDPDGKVIDTGERVFRVLADTGWSLYQDLVSSGVLSCLGTRVVKTWVCEDAGTALPRIPATQGLEGHPVLEHERIPFPSYPCEWSPRMLFDVGEFLLDLLSFERLPPDLRVWLPQAQFERNFLYPLMIYSFLGLPPGDFFLKCRDGVELEQAAGLLCRGFWVLRPTVFTNLFMPVLLGKFFRDPTKGLSSTVQHSSPSPQDESAREKNLFTLNTLQTILGWKYRRFAPSTSSDMWTRYGEEAFSYEEAERREKETFVETFFSSRKGKRVLDVGANTGRFSFIAARAGGRVVAIDDDLNVVERIYLRARQEAPDRVLPLRVNFARPTPEFGWNNAEYRSFLSRSEGAFDVILFLAVMHHLLITDRIPLPEILSLLRRLVREQVVFEYVDFEDPMVKSLLKGRDALFPDWNRTRFEEVVKGFFLIVEVKPVARHRWVYILQK